jgi:hypothetical protein
METYRLPPPKPKQQYIGAWLLGTVSSSYIYFKKYGAFRIFCFIWLAAVLLVVAAMTFVGGLTQKPRGTGEGLQMTLGTGLLLLAFAGVVFVIIRRIRGPNPRRKTPAGWYPDPLGIRRLRWFNGTDWTDSGAGADLRPSRAGTLQPLSSPAGWYPDPAGSARLRYFTGTDWTDNYSQQPLSR